MKRVALAILVGLVVLAQMSFLPGLRPLGVVPNLALVFVVLVGLESAASITMVVAVVCGVLLDLASGANLGMWTGVLVLAALVAGLLHRAGVETDGPLVPAVMVAGGTLVVALVVLSGLVNVAIQWPMGQLLGRFVLELMLNLILMVVLRPLIRRVVPTTPSETMAIG